MNPAAFSALLDAFYPALQVGGLAASRPMGLTLMCSIFAWAHLTSGLLRMGFAIALALPVMAPLMGRAPSFLASVEGPFLLLVAKEMLIGLLLGFVLSFPFEALVAAGGIVDSTRGSGAPGQSPTGEITPYGQLFAVMGLWLFAALGGFWAMADMLYRSYAVWRPGELLPPLSAASLPPLIDLLAGMARSALVLAAPAVILLVACDLVFMVSARMGKQFNVAFLSASVKNLILLALAPFFAMALMRVLGPSVLPSAVAEATWRALLR